MLCSSNNKSRHDHRQCSHNWCRVEWQLQWQRSHSRHIGLRDERGEHRHEHVAQSAGRRGRGQVLREHELEPHRLLLLRLVAASLVRQSGQRGCTHAALWQRRDRSSRRQRSDRRRRHPPSGRRVRSETLRCAASPLGTAVGRQLATGRQTAQSALSFFLSYLFSSFSSFPALFSFSMSKFHGCSTHASAFFLLI